MLIFCHTNEIMNVSCIIQTESWLCHTERYSFYLKLVYRCIIIFIVISHIRCKSVVLFAYEKHWAWPDVLWKSNNTTCASVFTCDFQRTYSPINKHRVTFWRWCVITQERLQIFFCNCKEVLKLTDPMNSCFSHFTYAKVTDLRMGIYWNV